MYTSNSREHDVPLLDFLPQEQVDGDNSLQSFCGFGEAQKAAS